METQSEQDARLGIAKLFGDDEELAGYVEIADGTFIRMGKPCQK